jgi:hypothetical protein
MSSSMRQKLRGAFAAVGRALVARLTAMVTLGVMLMPSVSWADTPYSLHWVMIEENPMCETAVLERNGSAYFDVNATPLPTFMLPGALVTHANGSQTNTAEAPFSSTLLRMGANDFDFAVRNATGQDWCVHAQELVSLVSVPLGLNKPLFDVRRDGTAFVGSTTLNLSLAEINPQLARDIANLEVAIEAERQWLIDNAAKTADLAARLSALQALDTELKDLVRRPLDEIAQTDLDAILDRYAKVVDDATKAALHQIILDLQQSVLDLEHELASLIDLFGAQADAVANFATGAARDAGFSPDDPSSYALGPAAVPWVTIPDVSSIPGAFDPGNDPYAAYADKVIAALQADISGSKVTGRADFVANVRAWRANEAALQKALMERVSVSQAETNAFLNGQNKVTDYVHQFMNASDWFTDSPVPADLRSDVDGVLKQDFGPLADEMKDALNLWQGNTLDLEHTQLYQTITAFAGAMSTIGDGFAAYGEMMQTLVHATTRVGIGFVPYVGPVLDLCEAVTGKEWCLPSGKELSTEERIFSGVGFAISGGVKVWGGVKNAGVSPAAKEVAIKVSEKAGQLGEDYIQALNKTRRTWYKTLEHGAVTTKLIDAFEAKVGKSLLDEGHALLGVGDDGVRKVLKMKPGDPACDFLSVNKGNKLVLSEAKGIEAATEGGKGGVDAGHAVEQLTSTMKKLKEKGLAGDVGRAEIRIPKGAPIKGDYGIKDGNLIIWSTGETIHLKDFPLVFVKVVQI